MRLVLFEVRGFAGLVLLAACSREFPNEPIKRLTIQAGINTQDTMMVRDTAALSLEITDETGHRVTGIEVDWHTGNSSLLELRRAQSTGSRQDSLTSQLSIQAIAHARGKVAVTATVDRLGFEPAEFVDTITILEWWGAVSAGSSHTCSIASDSSAYCWGAGSTGALGNGGAGDSPVPVPILGFAGLNKFVAISAGQRSTCAIVIQRLVHCWGQGDVGQLGNGSQSNQYTPVPISLGRSFENLSAGPTTCGVTLTSRGFCWGSNSDSQLGAPQSGLGFDHCGSIDCALTPRAVQIFADSLLLAAIDVGTTHTCGISKDVASQGLAFCWGKGVLGPNPGDTVFLLGDSVYGSLTPIRVAAPSGTTQRLAFISIGVGDRHVCGIGSTGITFCWGSGTRGQLGNNTRANRAKPFSAQGGVSFTAITAGNAHTCALSSSGIAYCWGANDYGQLGVDSTSTADRLTPTPVLGGLVFRSLSAGQFHTCGVTAAHALYCWGQNIAGQLGTVDSLRTCTVGSVTTSCSLVPKRVAEPIR